MGRWIAEGPQHKVTIPNGFWLGQTPVTQAFYEAVIGQNPSGFQGDTQRPVENVSWEDVVAFCDRLNQLLSELGDLHARLPSEAEWEYACRAGMTAALYNGKELTSETEACPNLAELAWYYANSGNTTHPVAQKRPNDWGLHDMLGNVLEWCQDAWHDNYTGAPADGSAWAGEGRFRVSRGGSWAHHARDCRCACRLYQGPGNRNHNLGFRLVLAVSVKEDIRPFS